MNRSILAPILVLFTVFSSATIALAAPPMHGYEGDMEQRTEQRRRKRLDAGKGIEQDAVRKNAVIAAVNLERAKKGIAPLSYHRKLERSAQAHAQDMRTRNFFSHETPEGRRSSDRIQKTGYGVVNSQKCRCSYHVSLGENIAKGQKTVEHVIRAWMESQTHRDAILSSDYADIGVGIVGDIWVLHFGSVEVTPGRGSSDQ